MKFLDDLYYNNVYYAKIGGIPTSEMNALELEFLFRLNFDLHAPQEEYERYKYELHAHASRATSCSCAADRLVPDEQLAAARDPLPAGGRCRLESAESHPRSRQDRARGVGQRQHHHGH